MPSPIAGMHRNTEPPYVELHLHTAYSLLDGASLPEELVLRAAQLGYRALAITDHDNVSGAVEFGRACEAVGIQPITGAEITLADGSHLTLLCTSRRGYANLCRLLTRIRHGEPPAPVPLEGAPLDPDAPCLADFAEGLLLLTGCRSGQLARAVDAGRLDDAIAILRTSVAWFGAGNVYVELQHNAVFGDTRRIAYLSTLA
ncbi:MAG: PHP domain-containing protein, partial [Thermomicrobiales bacterium]